MSVDYLKTSVGFKHGLMLGYQFVQLLIQIHKKQMVFGHLDFQNMYFLKNGSSKPQLSSSETSWKSKKSFKNQIINKFNYDLLFIEKDLHNIL